MVLESRKFKAAFNLYHRAGLPLFHFSCHDGSLAQIFTRLCHKVLPRPNPILLRRAAVFEKLCVSAAAMQLDFAALAFMGLGEVSH